MPGYSLALAGRKPRRVTSLPRLSEVIWRMGIVGPQGCAGLSEFPFVKHFEPHLTQTGNITLAEYDC